MEKKTIIQLMEFVGISIIGDDISYRNLLWRCKGRQRSLRKEATDALKGFPTLENQVTDYQRVLNDIINFLIQEIQTKIKEEEREGKYSKEERNKFASRAIAFGVEVDSSLDELSDYAFYNLFKRILEYMVKESEENFNNNSKSLSYDEKEVLRSTLEVLQGLLTETKNKSQDIYNSIKEEIEEIEGELPAPMLRGDNIDSKYKELYKRYEYLKEVISSN